MNCDSFRRIARDLAVDLEVKDADRHAAQAHAAGCAACAARLADERALSEALRTLAAADAGVAAPEAVEIALLEQLASLAEAPAGAKADPMPRSPHVPSFSVGLRNRRARVVLAVAASLVCIAASYGLWNSARRAHESPAPLASAAIAVSGVLPPSGERVATRMTGDGEADRFERRHRALVSNTTRPSARPSEQSAVPAGDLQVATEFLPLNGMDLQDGEPAHLVRVTLPRQALLAFGLALNEERGTGAVQADVLVGEDGLARAIRFVR